MQKDLTGLNKEEKRDYWKGWVSKWERSGEDKTAFCRNQGLNYDLFTYYSRRYALKKEGSVFIPVQLSSSVALYEVVFPSGVILKFSANLPLPELIRSVRDSA